MVPAHAVAVAEARSCIAALADHAATVGASAAYERALIALDWINGDHVPALDTLGLTDDRDTLTAVAVSAIEQLCDHGVDALQVELLLAALADARALGEP